MRAVSILSCTVLLGACVPTTTPVSSVPKGPAIEIVEAARAADTSRIVLRYKDGSAIPEADESRAVLKAQTIACQEGESAIADTRTRSGGLLTVNVFCVGVLQSDEVIDGTRLKT